MPKIVTLPTDIILRPYQQDFFNAFFFLKKKRLAQIIHRRAGKDLSTLNLCAIAMLQEPIYVLYLFPEKTQARKVIWTGLRGDGKKFLNAFPEEAIRHKQNAEMKIEYNNGSIFQLSGSDRYDNLRGTNPKLIVFSEYAESNPAAWHTLSPILRENKGTAIFVYTVRGRNHGYRLYRDNKKNKDWFVQYLNIRETFDHNGDPIITEDDILQETLSGIPKHIINQEYYLDWDAANPGAYYADEFIIAREEKRITNFNADPNLDVYTSWDLGINDQTAIWFFQAAGKEIRFIHYYENQDKGLDHYIDYLRSFSDKNNIRYGGHFAPHDIAVRELSTGNSRFEYCWKNGLHFNVGFPNNRIPRLSVIDGIQAVRSLFKYFWFNESECQKGLDALASYYREFNSKTSRYDDSPKHDWASNCADSLRIMAIAWQDRFGNPREGFQHVPAQGNAHHWG